MVDERGGHARTALAILAGLGLGFVLAGLATEFYEEFASEPRYENGDFTGIEDGPLADTFGLLGAGTTFLVTLALLWAAHRRRGVRGGLLLGALAVSTPAWYAFYQVDHREALLGVGLSLCVAWTVLSWTRDRSGRVALAAGMALATAVPLANMWLFSRPPFNQGLDPQQALMAGLGAASLAALLGVLARLPEDRLHRAGGVGALATALATALLAFLPAFDRFGTEEAWIFVMGLVVLTACAAVAWTSSRPLPDAEPPTA